jgi:hypothetical protein
MLPRQQGSLALAKSFVANEAKHVDEPLVAPSWTVLSDKGGASFTVELPTATWIELPAHPLHRNVEKHAARDQWKLAKRAQGAVAESLRWLIGAEYNGQVYKLDGHTRAYLWKQGRLPTPETVFATIYRCKSRDELLKLYTTFETQPNTGRQQDRVFAAMRELDLELRSRRLRHGAFADVLSLAWRGKTRGIDSTGRKYEDFDVRQALATFEPELRLLDAIGPTPEVFYTGVCAAALLALALDAKSIEFFRDVADPVISRKDAPPYTPVQVVRREIELLREKKKSARDRNAQEMLCAVALGAVELWRRGPSTPGYYSDGTVQPVRVIDRVRAVHAAKGTPGNYFPTPAP